MRIEVAHCTSAVRQLVAHNLTSLRCRGARLAVTQSVVITTLTCVYARNNPK